jgi:AcrR family transcriptional regulator
MVVSSSAPISTRESAATRSRAATRERLLASGVELFAAKGLHTVTSHDVARAAGVATGTFYLHFGDKRELFRQSVPRLARALVLFAEEHRDWVRIIFSVDRDTLDVESDLLSELATSIADGRRQRIASGETSASIDPVILSQALVGMWARVIAWWVEDPSRATRTTLIETLTAIQLTGTHPAR